MSRRKVSDSELIKALLETSTQQEAAEKLGITPQTITARMKKPDFIRKYHNTQGEILRSVTRKIANASNASVQLLVDVLMDEEQPMYYRLSVAKEILRMTRDFTKVDELYRRLTQIEYEVAERTENELQQQSNPMFRDVN